ncbi:MAG: response regulator transcription factor [Alphaproteobacteria bacterium]|nr:response regulator transcription factor [Alphaproteobacteria bacterium]MBL6937704.1 response regulator transcription factor [Alphaproteobacteria bacterium]MBL7099042.1 response regulator transcription factor [Alphaproteobacteria bacterium]
MTSELLISVVDDDAGVCDSIRLLLESADYAVKTYASARQFLEDKRTIACLIADIRMPEMDGLELQQEIVRRGSGLPVIMITGHGDVPLAVRAMKAGAVDFIEKPFDDEQLLTSVKRAIEIGHRTRGAAAEAAAAERLLALLTPRERTVLEQLVVGRSNKVAAYELGISPRTVEIHRAHIMDKMNARSLSDLVRISLAASKAGNA